MIICLPIRLLSGSSELLLTESRDVFNPIFCFVLALNKDLAVSFLHCCKIIPPRRDARPFGRSRFCSHLTHYCGRPLAAIILSFAGKPAQESVRTFLPKLALRAITHLAETFLLYQIKGLCQVKITIIKINKKKPGAG